jgi:hypothetical protein
MKGARIPIVKVSGRIETADPALTSWTIVLTSSSSMQILGFTPARFKAVSSRIRVAHFLEVRTSDLGRVNTISI